jgi:hypothetical protein
MLLCFMQTINSKTRQNKCITFPYETISKLAVYIIFGCNHPNCNYSRVMLQTPVSNIDDYQCTILFVRGMLIIP